jgi:hypothetical protein
MLFASIQNKLLTLPDPTRVFPAHGAGSACGKNLSTETSSTMGVQRRDNYALQFTDADLFVAAVTEGQPEAPGYFIYDAVLNQKNRDTLDEHVPPTALTVTQLLDARDNGLQIIDTNSTNIDAVGYQAEGSRVFQWGWNPVGGSRASDAGLTPNDLVLNFQLASVTISTT